MAHHVEPPTTRLRFSSVGIEVDVTKRFFHAETTGEQVISGTGVDGVHVLGVLLGNVERIRLEQRAGRIQGCEEQRRNNVIINVFSYTAGMYVCNFLIAGNSFT